MHRAATSSIVSEVVSSKIGRGLYVLFVHDEHA